MSDVNMLNGLALDGRHLNQLKTMQKDAPDEAAKAAAQQFEALFVQQMMKTMRQAGGESELFNSNAMETYTEMLDQQFSTDIAKRGVGLAEQLLTELQQKPK